MRVDWGQRRQRADIALAVRELGLYHGADGRAQVLLDGHSEGGGVVSDVVGGVIDARAGSGGAQVVEPLGESVDALARLGGNVTVL